MNSSTAVFTFKRSDGSVCLLNSKELPMVETYDEVGYSVIRSLAAFIAWQFPGLPAPHKQTYKHAPIHYLPQPATFPNYQSKLHPMYIEWMNVFCDAVEGGRALRYGSQCYFRVEVDEQYMKLLLEHGFQASVPFDLFEWNCVCPGLKDKMPQDHEATRTRVAFVSCSDHHLSDEPYVDLRTHYYGQFFNNEQWVGFNVLKCRPPTVEELVTADVIIIPGSNLSVYDQHPQVMLFAEALKSALKAKPDLKVLGVCFGHQLLASVLGGKVTPANQKTEGAHPITLQQSNLESKNFGFLLPLRNHTQLLVTENHGDEVSALPPGFVLLANSSTCPAEMIMSESGKYLGLQCHPEYTTKEMLTHEIQVAHHQHKEKSMELISTLLERMNSDRKDEGSQVLREVILKFIGNK